MTSLTERYIASTIEALPESQRDEVAAELRGAINDMIEQRVEHGEPELAATRGALEELGNPRKLAASYAEAPQYLIGPGWYPAYIVVLKRILPVALALIAAITMITDIALDEARLIDALVSSLGSVIWGGLQILFWVTLGFAIAERTIGDAPDWGQGGAWSVEDLPEPEDENTVGLGETMGTIVTLVIFGGLVLIQQSRGVGFFIFGDNTPDWDRIALVNPDLGIGWVIGFAGLLVVSIAVAIAGYLQRTWDMRMVVLTAVDSALWIAYVVALAVSEPIVNPEFARRVDADDATWWAAGDRANQVIATVIIAYSVWAIWEAWQRANGSRRRGDAIARQT